jgi:hypothetical protein
MSLTPEELSTDSISEELMKLSPEDLWDVILGDETLDERRERQERHRVCAAHERSLGDRMEWAAWEAYAKRHGAPTAPPLHLPVPERMRPRGFG